MMKHLGYLKMVNYLMAGFYAVAGMAIFPLCLLAMHFVPEAIPSNDLQMMFGAGFVGVLLCLGLAVFAYTMGRNVAEGRWRLVQTIWAVLSLGNNPPIGLAYGAYALWVCWANAETREVFDAAG